MKIRGFELVRDEFKRTEGVAKLPTRGTSKAMAYDFYSNANYTIKPNEIAKIWTDVKSYMQENEALILNVRSSMGGKFMLANTQGWVESDFADNPQTDGNIGFCLFNTSDKPYEIHKGDKIGQAMLIHYDTFENGNTNVKRMGGIGSTGR